MKKIEALLHVKEGLKTEQFIKEHSSDAAAFWWDATEQRKGGNGKHKKYEKSRKIEQLLFTNDLIGTFPESSSNENEGNVRYLVYQ